MAGKWTEARRRRHSRRIKQLVKLGVYKKAMNQPGVLEANKQRALDRENDPKFKKRHRKACKVAMNRPETRKRLSESSLVRDNTNIIKAAKSLSRRRKVSRGQKLNWDTNINRKLETSLFKKKWWSELEDEEKRLMVSKIMSSNGVSPNKTEKRITKFFERLGYEYEFTGDGKKIVSGHCPDFVDEKRKEIIEFNGIYWHRDRKKDVARLKDFAKAGYRCLAIYAEGLDKHNAKKFRKALVLFREGKPRYSPICMATCS